MSKQLRSGAVRRMGLAGAILIAGSSAALALGAWFPGSWKVVDSGKTVRKRQSGMVAAVIKNKGPDIVQASSKGTLKTVTGEIAPGAYATLILPAGAKNVKLLDANFANGKGSRGSLVWSKSLPFVGPIIGGGGGQQ